MDFTENKKMAIRHRNYLTFSATGSNISVHLWGVYDGFPWHEIYVNKVPILQYNPCLAGKTPYSLFEPMDEAIDISTVVPAQADDGP